MFSSSHLLQCHPFPLRVYRLPLPFVSLGFITSPFLWSKDIYFAKLYLRFTPAGIPSPFSIVSFSPSLFSVRPSLPSQPLPRSVTSGYSWVLSPFFSHPVQSSPAAPIPCSPSMCFKVYLGKLAHAWGKEPGKGVRLPKKMKNVSGREDFF